MPRSMLGDDEDESQVSWGSDGAGPVRVGVYGDDALMRRGLMSMVSRLPRFAAACETAHADALAAALMAGHLDLLCLDLDPFVAARLELIRLATDRGVHILTITATPQAAYVVLVLAAGARGCVAKSAQPERMEAALTAVTGSDLYFEGCAADRLAAVARAFQRQIGVGEHPLTPRELEVLRMVVEGIRNVDIGRQLYMSESTVKQHVHRILVKLGCESRLSAAVIAVRRGIV